MILDLQQACCAAEIVPEDRMQRARAVLRILAERAAKAKLEGGDEECFEEEMTPDEAAQLLAALTGLKVHHITVC